MPTRDNIDNYKMANGVATTPLTSEEQAKDTLGYTNTNLHRRIDVHSSIDPQEVAPRKYTLGVYGVNSYRTTEITYHDEESTTCEIP